MNDADAKAAIESLNILCDMACDREVSLFNCRDCAYFYRTNYNTIACIKNNIMQWTLFRIEKNKKKG